jgi:hopanoid biosynthesis associated RND transporter like protein HpnN
MLPSKIPFAERKSSTMSNEKVNKGLFGLIARNARPILAIALILSILSIYYTQKNLKFLTGRDDLMPKNTQFHKDYREYRREFGDMEEMVVVMESADQEKAARFGELLQEKLRNDKRNFNDVFFPYGLTFFKSNGFLFMPLRELLTLRENIIKAKPVLKALSASPSIQTLFASLTGQIEAYLSTGAGSANAGEQLAGLTFMLDKLGKGFEDFGKSGQPSFSLEEFLMSKGKDGEESSFAKSGRMQILTVLPVKDPSSFVPAEKSIKLLRAYIRELQGVQDFKGVKVGLTGTPVLEYEEMSTSQHDIAIATVISVVLTVILLLFAFRGVVNVFAAMVSLLIALSLSFGLATLLIGHLNILSMVFAIMLLGIGIEYGIQVVLRYQEELGGGNTEFDAIRTGLEKNVWAIVMAAATVACAFLTFIFTDFKGIAELGIIAGCGIAICVIVTFTVLPAMLVVLAKYRKPGKRMMDATTNADQPGSPVTGKDGKLGLFGRILFGHPKVVIAITMVLCIASIYPLLHVKFDYNLLNLQARGLESVDYAYKLMKNSENSGYFAVVTASSSAEAATKSRALEALPSVDHVVSLNTFVPDDQEQKLEVIKALKRELADIIPAKYEEDLRVMELPAVFENFRNATERLKVCLEREKKTQAIEVNNFLNILDRFFAKLDKEKDTGALGMLREFQGGMLASLPEKINFLKASLNPSRVTVADIPQQLKTRFFGRTGKYLLQVAPKREIFEREPLKAFIDDVRKVDAHVTGEPIMVYESMTIMRDAYRGAFIYAFIAISIILLITFRSFKAAAIGLIPLIVGVLFMVSGMWLTGIDFNSANIIVMPLVLGIAVDSGIYIINRFRREGETSVEVVSRSAGRGVLYNTFMIMASFGALMVAHHRGVFSIGAVMSMGMAACQIAFILVLPAVLTLCADKYRPKKVFRRGDAGSRRS